MVEKMKKKVIMTRNREVYEKLNMLNISPEVLLESSKPHYIDKIMKTVNKENKVLDYEIVGRYIVLKKKSPINFNVFYNKN